MKCIKTTEDTVPVQIKKVSEEKAMDLINKGSWEYISKSVYKRIKAQKGGGDKNTSE